jgi:hypothetical protein
MRRLVILAVLLIAATACGSDPFPTEADRPPDLVVTAGDEQVTLNSYSYCWSKREGASSLNVCADGVPGEPLPILTLTEGLVLSAQFPLPWVITALFRPNNDECGASSRIEIDINGDPIAVPGPTGSYRVEFFGRGAEGDGSWALELTTTEPGTIAPPSAQVFWSPAATELDPDTSFSAFISNLFGRPPSVSADIAVTAGNGTAADFPLIPAISSGCDGEIGFDGDPTLTGSIVDLGPPPYEITITADIGGTVVTSDPVVWPDDFADNSNESARVGADLVTP